MGGCASRASKGKFSLELALEAFRQVGRLLWEAGLVSSHGGNMSVKLDNGTLAITRHGCMLGRIEEGDLVQVAIDGQAQGEPSMDTAIHRSIYEATAARTVIHAHPPHAVALSLLDSTIEPRDLEGQFYLGSMAVIEAAEITMALEKGVIAAVRGHGSYARGATLEEALQWTSVLEESARVLWLLRSLPR